MHSEAKELNLARSNPDPVDRTVRTACTTAQHYNGTRYRSTETVLLMFPFIQTNITSVRCGQLEVKEDLGCNMRNK